MPAVLVYMYFNTEFEIVDDVTRVLLIYCISQEYQILQKKVMLNQFLFQTLTLRLWKVYLIQM